MIDKFTDKLVALSRIERSRFFKIGAILGGATVMLLLAPAALVAVSEIVLRVMQGELWRLVEVVISFFALAAGLGTVIWAAVTQWQRGHGTPAPIAPPQELIVDGPYRLCRNPIQLGAMLYYLAVGTLYHNLITGILCFTMALGAGHLYHRRVEERELEKRFGEAYAAYRDRTPFVFPRFGKRNGNGENPGPSSGKAAL